MSWAQKRLQWLINHKEPYNTYIGFQEWIAHMDEFSFDNLVQLINLSEGRE